jgi:hypothetical protein
MKNITQSIIKYTIWAIIFTATSYAYAAWSEPTVPPPGGNPDTPINAGTGSQTKTGFLWTQGIGSNAGGYFATTIGVGVSSTTDPVTLGLTGVFGGKVGATEYCDNTGAECISVPEIIDGLTPEPDSDLICPTNPSISTMADLNGSRLSIPYATYAADKADDAVGDDMYWYNNSFIYAKTRPSVGTFWAGGWNTANVTIPEACKSEAGCVIKQVIYRRREYPYSSAYWSEKAEKVKYVDYHEDSSSGFWTTTDVPKGATNGNTTSTNMLKSYVTTVNGTAYQVILRDDRSGYDVSRGIVRPYDNWGAAGEEIYFCTYGSDTAI